MGTTDSFNKGMRLPFIRFTLGWATPIRVTQSQTMKRRSDYEHEENGSVDGVSRPSGREHEAFGGLLESLWVRKYY